MNTSKRETMIMTTTIEDKRTEQIFKKLDRVFKGIRFYYSDMSQHGEFPVRITFKEDKKGLTCILQELSFAPLMSHVTSYNREHALEELWNQNEIHENSIFMPKLKKALVGSNGEWDTNLHDHDVFLTCLIYGG